MKNTTAINRASKGKTVKVNFRISGSRKSLRNWEYIAQARSG